MQNRQDFENVDQQLYDIEFGIANDAAVAAKRARLIVATINIFDNPPQITYAGPCVVEELRANVNTGCLFTVNHKDGTLNNPFRLSIEGRFDESRLFGFSEPFNEHEFSREYHLM